MKYFQIDPSINLVKGDVSDSHLNAGGGGFDHPLEINEGAPWDPMLLKVILKPTKILITCQKSGHYLENSPIYLYRCSLSNCLGFSSRIPSLQDFAPIRRYHLFLKIVIKDSKLISHGNAHCLVDWRPMIIFLQASFQER